MCSLGMGVLKARYQYIHLLQEHYTRTAQIQGARSPEQLHYVWWHLIFVGPQWNLFHVVIVATIILS
jgi:hypothetical protein